MPNCLKVSSGKSGSKERTRGRKGPTTLPLCQKVGGSVRALSGARECLLTRPGLESGVRDSRGGPAVLVIWLMRSWRGIVLKKSQLGEDRCNFKPRRTDHTEEEHRPTGADSDHGGEPPSFPWSIPTGEPTAWPPQHKSKPTASMPRRAPGPGPRGESPASSSTQSHTA